MVRLVDVYPTILELAGLTAPPGIRGESLIHVSSDAPRDVYAELDMQRSLRRGDWKLIADRQRESLNGLYDLRHDPRETNNVDDRDRDIVRRLSSQIRRIEREIAERSKARPTPIHERRLLDDVTLERMRSLGYTK